MKLEFRKPVFDDAREITNFKEEFQNGGMDGTGTLFRISAEEWLEHIQKQERCDDPDAVPCLQYGLFEEGNGRLLGLIQIRLTLNGYLVDFGGHIGYSVRPSERRKRLCKNNAQSRIGYLPKRGPKQSLDYMLGR